MTDCLSSRVRMVGKFNMIQSWGVASARHTSATVVYPQENSCCGDVQDTSTCSHDDDTEQLLDVPLGLSIIRWDIRSNVRRLQFQAHRDLVTCMRMSPNKLLIATSCYSGEVKLWDSSWKCLDEVNAPMASQHHLAWSHDSKKFLIIGNGYNSSVVMYNVISQDNDRDVPTLKLKQAWQVKAGIDNDQAPNVYDQRLESTGRECAVEYHYGDAFYMGEITPSGNVIAIEERPGRVTLIELYSPKGQLMKTVELKLKDRVVNHPTGQDGGEEKEKIDSVRTLYMSTCRNGCYAVGVQGGTVVMVGENLEILTTIKVGTTGRTCVWDGDNLVLPTDSGKLVWWSITGEKVGEFKVGSPDYVVRLVWSVSGCSLWMCGFSTLSLLSVKRDKDGVVTDVYPSHVIHSHEITCCGVGFSPSGKSIGSGDLAGNVWVTESTKVAPIYKYTVSASVRCLVWRSEHMMLVGCLDGQVHQCPVDGTSKVLLQLEGGVIHMRFNRVHQLLAICSTKGMLEVFSSSASETEGVSGLKVVAKFLAHPPKQGPQDMRFGQLGKQAEIWSLCWSPDDKKMATCSEDQTTRIWDTSTWKCITILTGHTLAVTSVDWKQIGQQNLIATCADDRTIRLTDGETFNLLRILNTTDIYGWHTLTYLSFHPAKDSCLLLCTTQNGHVVVWDSATGERITRGKMHLGSIEGLAWKDEYKSCEGNCEGNNSWVATVGADCVVNLFNLL